MKAFRTLVLLLLAIAAGVVAAHWMSQHGAAGALGQVVVRTGGYEYVTTLPRAALLLVLGLLVLALAWKLLTLPFRTWRRYRRRQLRARLNEGFHALHRGHWSRAERLLLNAGEHADVGALALAGAVRAADARGDETAATQHLQALAGRDPVLHALLLAERLLARGRPAEAVDALDAPAAQPLPPRGLLLRAQALAESGRAGDAYGMLGSLKQQHALAPDAYAALEARLAAQALREAADANALAERWEALPKPLRTEPAVVAAYAERAAALRWDDAALRSLEQALDARWDESLARLYGRLPVERYDSRRASAQRWLQAHPASPALLLALGRLARLQGQWTSAQEFLHRALAQGAGAEAWEELGDGFAQAGDDGMARLCYANALGAARGEPVADLPGRELRARIYDQAVVEDRDEHGFPRLRE